MAGGERLSRTGSSEKKIRLSLSSPPPPFVSPPLASTPRRFTPPPSRADYFKIQHPLSGLRSLASLHPPLPPSHLSSSLALPHHNPTPNRSRHDFNQVSSGSRAMSEFESRGKAESYIAARAASMANRWESRKSGKYKPRSKSGRRPSRAAPGLPASDNAAAIRCVTSAREGGAVRRAVGLQQDTQPLALSLSFPPSLPPSLPPILPPFLPSTPPRQRFCDGARLPRGVSLCEDAAGPRGMATPRVPCAGQPRALLV